MFEPGPGPRVFALPPGADFGRELVAGMADRAEDLSATRLYVNTSRMQRRLRQVFDDGPARLLPQIRLVSDLALEALSEGIAAPVSPLRRRFELAELVQKLVATLGDFAPGVGLYDLTDSLARLIDEMHGEGVTPAAFDALSVEDQSGHWDRALAFLKIAAPFFDTGSAPPDVQARQRQVAMALAARWATTPPDHPVIVAGSTGSRGATQLFMRAVAHLPQGALVLPGFDFDMPQAVWDRLADPMEGEDHPQRRFRHLLDALGLDRAQVRPWTGTTGPDHRNRLISLSLRPAPVTDAWRRDGPALGDLVQATAGLALLEADSPRAEADAIALRLRQAVEEDRTAALITPDRMLTRQVAAALDRWDIVADDSAGLPLPLSPPGRILRHVGQALGQPMTAEALLVLLKHPLTHSTETRNDHLLRTRRLELHLRRNGPPYPDAATLATWADRQGTSDPGAAGWAAWVGLIITSAAEGPRPDLAAQLHHHVELTERLCGGTEGAGSGALWEAAAGRVARAACDRIALEADASGPVGLSDYLSIFEGVLREGEVRDRDAGHPRVFIWGTLEARVGGADLVILGGLNDGTWPEAPKPDPWLNRQMRRDVGLPLPDRRIGLSAHDYQQAVAAPEVWLSRAKRSSDAETVPSRWLNRLINLMEGLPAQSGPEALAAMRARAAPCLAQSAALGLPGAEVPRAPRPSPRPPVAARPDRISVTQVKTLIRDPYAIYARKILRLDPLDPLQPTADAPLRGVIVHRILERFIAARRDAASPEARTQFIAIMDEELTSQCPWPTVRLNWRARLLRSLDAFLADEALRQATGTLAVIEANGRIDVGTTGVTLTCKADRMDRDAEGRVVIYDYKTGAVPTATQQRIFDKQLLLEAAMVERGAFAKLGAAPVASAAFLGLGSAVKTVAAPLDEEPPDIVWARLEALLLRWADPATGYTARRAMFRDEDFSAYDHLSRKGEWSVSDPPRPEDMA